jgi:hypothetical protein
MLTRMSRLFESTDVFAVLGRRGSGKSYLARRIQECYPRKVVFDTLGEYRGGNHLHCSDFESFGQRVLELQDAKAFTLVYDFDVEKEDHLPEFDQALRVLFYRGNLLVCVEEIQALATAHKMPMWLKHCLLRGRHRNLGLLFTTQRPGECHKTIISQAGHVFCGSLHEKNDLDYCRAVLGERALELGTLPEREFLYFRPGHGTVHIDNDLRAIKKRSSLRSSSR